MANEAIELLENNIQIEIENEKVFDFLRYVEKVKNNFRINCKVNELNQGWTLLNKNQ